MLYTVYLISGSSLHAGPFFSPLCLFSLFFRIYRFLWSPCPHPLFPIFAPYFPFNTSVKPNKPKILICSHVV